MNKPNVKQVTLPGTPKSDEKAGNWKQSSVELPNNTTSVIYTKKRP